MSGAPGDQARVTALVRVPVLNAFRIFTEEIDAWWRRGMKYRLARGRDGTIHLEPKAGGRLFEAFVDEGRERVVQTGEVLVWDPPHRLVLNWRPVNFTDRDPSTEVEVTFAPSASGTQVTVTHRGWAAVRPDHPARHSEAPAAFIGTLGRWWGGLMIALRDHAEPD